MNEPTDLGPLMARCAVCRGNIHRNEPYEIWEAAFYCQRHSMAYLGARAREYAARQQEVTPKPK